MVTGLSGSGPAYIYYLAEALEESAVARGLPEDIARLFVIQTFAGAAEMLQSQNQTPQQLRLNVMSPGGTTEAGIRVLKQREFKKMVDMCIEAAVKRSQELEALYCKR